MAVSLSEPPYEAGASLSVEAGGDVQETDGPAVSAVVKPFRRAFPTRFIAEIRPNIRFRLDFWAMTRV
jgi:hypothetical protein